jgi:hypothetical protein
LPPLLDPSQQLGGGLLIEADQVDVDPAGKQPRRPALLHAHREQQPHLSGRVLGERRPPLRLPELGSAVGRGQHHDGSPGSRGRPLHLVNEVTAGTEVPDLEDGASAGGFELIGDPN